MGIEPYLFFNGRCEEAIHFYQDAIGAELLFLMRMKESPEPQPQGMPPGAEDKILHATLKLGGSQLMLSDGDSDKKPDFSGFCLSLNAANPAEAEHLFNALAKGGKVRMRLGKTFWSPCFGMLEDRFGVGWMVSIPD